MALLGTSGCGKTTTRQLLAGFLEPAAARSRWVIAFLFPARLRGTAGGRGEMDVYLPAERYPPVE